MHWGDNGLGPAVAQDRRSGAVLMVAFMNREALDRTLETGQAWFWSRGRQELWHKGATSGNYLHVRQVRRNCEDNSLLLLAQPQGPTCHTGARSCYYRTLDWLFAILESRRGEAPEASYTARLLSEGVDRIGRKIGEEAAEVIIAAKNRAPDELAAETGDLWYHSLVLLLEAGMTPESVYRVLRQRHRQKSDSTG
ncbi:MAG TPA: bifunctional phosphoribosyl-AMP cyclohydrolase/phosphoribosyl-ATP diphosphatase HisIE [Chloroflexota bacterium]|nr:bifunctional phosphoribosyl-AMP cyclohydrolase/phosphoribosyl-ATP diphosphatase HisIE [Chloroflexota bacterium]